MTLKPLNNILHRHKPPDKINPRKVECIHCDFTQELDDDERWGGFSSENVVMSDQVESTDFFCRECGAKSLLVETGGGDYYVGPVYYCDACNERFTMG